MPNTCNATNVLGINTAKSQQRSKRNLANEHFIYKNLLLMQNVLSSKFLFFYLLKKNAYSLWLKFRTEKGKSTVRMSTAGSIKCREPKLISFNYGKVPRTGWQSGISRVLFTGTRGEFTSQQHLPWFWQKCSDHNRAEEKIWYTKHERQFFVPFYSFCPHKFINIITNSMFIQIQWLYNSMFAQNNMLRTLFWW